MHASVGSARLTCSTCLVEAAAKTHEAAERERAERRQQFAREQAERDAAAAAAATEERRAQAVYAALPEASDSDLIAWVRGASLVNTHRLPVAVAADRMQRILEGLPPTARVHRTFVRGHQFRHRLTTVPAWRIGTHKALHSGMRSSLTAFAPIVVFNDLTTATIGTDRRGRTVEGHVRTIQWNVAAGFLDLLREFYPKGLSVPAGTSTPNND